MSRAYLAEASPTTLLTPVPRWQVEIAGNVLGTALHLKLKKAGKLTFPGFGKFTVHKTKARAALNPRTGEKICVKAGKTVRFKASPVSEEGGLSSTGGFGQIDTIRPA